MIIGRRGNKPFEDQRFFLRSEAEVEIFLMIGNERRCISEYPGKTKEDMAGFIQEYSDVLLMEDLDSIRTLMESAKEEKYIRETQGIILNPDWKNIFYKFADFFGEEEAKIIMERKKAEFEKYGILKNT